MKKLYLLTGVTGHLGSVTAKELLRTGHDIRALVLRGEEALVPQGVACVTGDVRDRRSLVPFFERGGYDRVTLIHCAGVISILSAPDPRLHEINVTGTKNIMEAAAQSGTERAVYVSSVHAIPERPFPELTRETKEFSPETVYGQYARSKAEATAIVLAYAEKGLNVSVVHPSGIIGPGDLRGSNHSVNTLKAMRAGRIRISVRGGYDFVDVRDAAAGILLCEERGAAGECYILSGNYITITEMLRLVRSLSGRRAARLTLPAWTVRAAAPLTERFSLRFGSGKPLLTPCSAKTLLSGVRFSREKAERELGYRVRPTEESIRDTLL
ncbi:MAG: NAD-dependent epimerase/dehydratase family protein [Clostridia bacterium]|nr:NAD-dependent epimerase/dehydratase family protein [Clostridia bacterium]